MEVTTAQATSAQSASASKTMADLFTLAVADNGPRTAIKYKDKATGKWVPVTYDEVGEIVRGLSLGLQELGIERDDKVSILGNTRPEWTYYDFAALCAGATVVPIYQSNSPEECQYVLENSGACAIVVEDETQLAKIQAVRDRLPKLEHVMVMQDGEYDGAMTRSELVERGRGIEAARFEERVASVTPEDVCTYIYTSGTTGPPKGCVITHGNYREMLNMVESENVLKGEDVAYLFLPLAHTFARLIEFGTIGLGATLVYWEGDPQKIIPNLAEVKPTYFASVPRMFEKIYTAATSAAEKAGGAKQAMFKWSVKTGRKVRERERDGRAVGPLLRAQYDLADRMVLSKVRGLFGGRLELAATGAAPISKEILEFFWACGILVLEGYGMTETSTAATINRPEDYKFGTVGRALPGCSVKIAGDGEILIKGPNIFQGYYRNDDATKETIVDGWLHTGDLGSLDEEGFLSITGRKKDIIITAGGKNITPANLENGLKQTQYISQAVVHGDRRPYLVALVTLDEEEVAKYAKEEGLGTTDMAELAERSEIRALVQRAVDEVNEKVARVEQVKKFKILPHDLSQESGELTPTLKVKRNVVEERYGADLDQLYAK